MRQSVIQSVLLRAAGAVSFVAVLVAASFVGAQDAPNHVVLVPSRGTTPFAAAVQAQAQYVAAYGDMRESLSMARKINAQAVAQEIKNSVDYIDAYFKGRAINKEARAKENPNYLARQEHLYDVRKRMIEKHLDQGSKVETLNWLLGELSVPVLSNQYMVGRGALSESPLNHKLLADDLSQLMLTAGGGHAISAGEGKSLEVHWPLALREADNAETTAARESFEQARADLFDDLRENRQVSEKTQKKLLQAVNGLFVALENAYPHKRRDDPGEFLDYNTAKQYLRSLLTATRAAVNSRSPHELDGSLRFQGGGVVELLQHMYRNGLRFAPPPAGGQHVYDALYEHLRALYVQFGQDQAAAAAPGAAPP